MKYLKINESDSVAVALCPIKKGEVIDGITFLNDIDTAHKFALVDIEKNQDVIKYGYPIGKATCSIKKGEHVHTHNVKTNLKDELEYTYDPIEKIVYENSDREVFLYDRKNGTYGIRNHLFIVPLVGCVNAQAELIKNRLEDKNNHSMGKVA